MNYMNKKYVSIICATFLLTLSVVSVSFAAWNPPQDFPGVVSENKLPPVTIGTIPQFKSGPLGLDIDNSAGTTTVSGAALDIYGGGVLIRAKTERPDFVNYDWRPVRGAALDTPNPISVGGSFSSFDVRTYKSFYSDRLATRSGLVPVCVNQKGILFLCTDNSQAVNETGFDKPINLDVEWSASEQPVFLPSPKKPYPINITYTVRNARSCVATFPGMTTKAAPSNASGDSNTDKVLTLSNLQLPAKPEGEYEVTITCNNKLGSQSDTYRVLYSN